MGELQRVEDIFFNEYLPETKIFQLDLDTITAGFSTYMEQNHPEEWDPKFDKTIYREVSQKFVNDPRTKICKG